MNTMTWKSVLLQLSILIIHAGFSYELSCKGERNENLDWYVSYKLPKINKEKDNQLMINGTAYAYITSTSPGSWKLSLKSIASPSSILANTLNEFYSNKEKLSYLFYNDESPPQFSGSSNGHLKGVVAFDSNTGYWLIHSIPKFADPGKYEYPDNALDNGQSILCITFQTNALNEISKQLLYSNPNIYAKTITKEINDTLDADARSIFTDKPELRKKPPFTRKVTMRSLRNKFFVSFAKDNQYPHDLYSSLIAPELKSSLTVETWRRGSGTVLPPSCESQYDVIDVQSINMTFPQRGKVLSAFFKYTEDHSKWAISPKNYVCIADMNRMASQEKRGGGAMCFVSKPVTRAFQSIISETDNCPI